MEKKQGVKKIPVKAQTCRTVKTIGLTTVWCICTAICHTKLGTQLHFMP